MDYTKFVPETQDPVKKFVYFYIYEDGDQIEISGETTWNMTVAETSFTVEFTMPKYGIDLSKTVNLDEIDLDSYQIVLPAGTGTIVANGEAYNVNYVLLISLYSNGLGIHLAVVDFSGLMDPWSNVVADFEIGFAANGPEPIA